MREHEFIWDDEKNRINIRKHGVSFEEAWTVFNDDFVIYFADEEHSQEEERFIVLGRSTQQRLLVVCHCYRENNELIRIFSARKANKIETNNYYGGAI